MAPSSRHSRTSTIRTVDDVFEQLSIHEEKTGEASLDQAREFISQTCKTDTKLARDSIQSLESPSIFFGVLCPDSKTLLKLMYKCNTVLGGIQATAFFFPIAQVMTAPWDFYCSPVDGNPDEFISRFGQISMFDMLEDISSDTAERVVYYRGNANGTSAPINVRIFVSLKSTIESILELKFSYQQSVISAIGGICFWPRLGKHRQFRAFPSNLGQSCYPKGNTICRTHISNLRKVEARVTLNIPSVYTGYDNKIGIIIFDNETKIPKDDFAAGVSEMLNIVCSLMDLCTFRWACMDASRVARD